MQDKIVIKHSHIEINDYNIGDCEKLENNFLIYNPTKHCYNVIGMEYIKEEKKLLLPRGIDIWYLEKLFNCSAITDYNSDPYDTIGNVMIKYLPRDDKQKEALRFMLSKGEYTSNRNRSQLSVNLNTGEGKTYCQVATMAFTEMKTIIITYSVSVLQQWKKCITDYTDIKLNEIYTINGSGSIYRLFNKKDTSRYKIYLVTHGTLQSYAKSNGWEAVGELFKHLKIGIKTYDENHLCFDNMCKIDFYTNTHITYYLTATNMRSDRDENQIFQLYFKNIPSLDLFDEDEDPHTNYICIKYNSHPKPQDISNCRNQYGLDRNAYTDYVITKENYYKMLHVIIDLALKNNGKNLIYIGTNKAILETYEWIINNYPELNGEVGIYTSIVKKEYKEQQKDKKIILSTTKSCGVAIDIKGLKMTVVLAEPFKSESLARQTLGRTRDDNTYYIDIVDIGFSQIRKYYNEKKLIFDKYAKETSEMILSDNELDGRVENILKRRKSKLISCISFISSKLISPISFRDKNKLEMPITFRK